MKEKRTERNREGGEKRKEEEGNGKKVGEYGRTNACLDGWMDRWKEAKKMEK